TNILAFGTFPFCVCTGSRSEWLIPWAWYRTGCIEWPDAGSNSKVGRQRFRSHPYRFLHRVVSKTVHYKRRAPRALTRYATGGRTARRLGSTFNEVANAYARHSARASVRVAVRLRELLCIAGAQDDIWCWARAADRRTDSSRSRPQDWPWRSHQVACRCRPRVHPRAHRFREHANAALELSHHLIEHRLHDRGHSRHHNCIV